MHGHQLQSGCAGTIFFKKQNALKVYGLTGQSEARTFLHNTDPTNSSFRLLSHVEVKNAIMSVAVASASFA